MEDLFLNNYLAIKALHVISVMFWMAGMFYLPRLFVYHTRAKVGSEMDKTFCKMESRLLKIIINPAMISSLIFGFAMIYTAGFSGYGKWMHAKLTLVFFLFAFHGMSIKHLKNFAKGQNKKSEKFYRIFNEGAPVLAFIIVILAIMKPF